MTDWLYTESQSIFTISMPPHSSRREASADKAIYSVFTFSAHYLGLAIVAGIKTWVTQEWILTQAIIKGRLNWKLMNWSIKIEWSSSPKKVVLTVSMPKMWDFLIVCSIYFYTTGVQLLSLSGFWGDWADLPWSGLEHLKPAQRGAGHPEGNDWSQHGEEKVTIS